MVHRFKTRHISAATAADAKAWAKNLGCTPAELRIALRAVGDSVERVKAYLHALNGRRDAEEMDERAELPPQSSPQPPPQSPLESGDRGPASPFLSGWASSFVRGNGEPPHRQRD